MLKRINIGDVQRVCSQAAGCRTTPRTDGNAFVASVSDEIPDDQEVAGKSHLLDKLDFTFQPFLVGLERVLQFPCRCQLLQPLPPKEEPLAGNFLKIAVKRFAGRHLEMGENVLFCFQVDIAALGHFQSARECLRNLAENRVHLLRGLEIELVSGKLQAVRVTDGLPGLNANQHVLGARILLGEVVAIVGGHQRDAGLARQTDHLRVNPLLFREALVLNLEIEIALAENIAKVIRGLTRRVEFVGAQGHGDFAA